MPLLHPAALVALASAPGLGLLSTPGARGAGLLVLLYATLVTLGGVRRS